MERDPAIPLSILDLVPIRGGPSAPEAIANTIDLARQAESFGYRRYWIVEHHLNPGVAGTSPALVIMLVADATTTIRVGSGAVQLGHRTPRRSSRSSASSTPCTRAASTSASVDRASDGRDHRPTARRRGVARPGIVPTWRAGLQAACSCRPDSPWPASCAHHASRSIASCCNSRERRRPTTRSRSPTSWR